MADLFPDSEPSFKGQLREAVQSLAANNIFIGTSSWKYSGWTGPIYAEQRYHYLNRDPEGIELDGRKGFAVVRAKRCVARVVLSVS